MQGIQRTFFSAELVSTLPDGLLKQLVADLQGEVALTLIVTIRHWASFLPSRYGKNCERRDSQMYARYLERVSDPSLQHKDFSFDQVLETLHGAVADTRALSFDNAVLDGGIVDAMRSAAEFPRDLADELTHTQTRVNVSKPWETTELKRILNGIAADLLKLPQDDLFNAIATGEKCERQFDFDLGRVPTDLREDLKAEIRRFESPIPAVPHATRRVEERLSSEFAHLFRNRNLAGGLVAHQAKVPDHPGTAGFPRCCP